ncbi:MULTISPECIES: hypothetical protein [unclassified Vibrio]|uniref:hypothetical protein n=1 Tax=unclassified Vibrio TaxID=2614977 RepID=UPI0029644AC9|nr:MULTISPECIES: hypothetical protein [unclassified Vibrio]MDW2024316.1 hypothetical protein [Vibrio sp. 397]MDW2028593.1 hypothetical protein [Vibrio sp. 399]MDW2214803.1 hypothetical protein [Vibrio sp. 1982]
MILNIIKRNRKYFAAETDSKRKCKLLIDSNSENLELGEHCLAVEDISVRSKYGTDLIYKLSASSEAQAEQGIVSLKADYNSQLVKECRKLGGSWDKEQGAWIFPGFVADEVEELDEIYNSGPVTVEIAAIEEIREYGKGMEFLGRPLCRAFGRDSGSRIDSDIALISGYATSGGSQKNWATILDEESVLRLQIPSKILEIHQDDRFDVKIIK